MHNFAPLASLETFYGLLIEDESWNPPKSKSGPDHKSKIDAEGWRFVNYSLG